VARLTKPARVVLLAGPSGSGKSYVARRTGLPVLALDDFYREGGDPALPRLPGGLVDWDDPASWNADDAVATIVRLCTEGAAEVPVYEIGADRRNGTHTLDLGDAALFVAEGIFAAEIVAACRDAGVLADAVALRRTRQVTYVRRLARDLREGRKAPRVLVRRGWALMRSEPEVLARQIALGCRPCNAHGTLRAVRTLLLAHAA
jgi:uridine kinase